MTDETIPTAESNNQPQVQLSIDNAANYFSGTVLPVLPQGTSVVEVNEVSENSFVNWVFAVDTVCNGDNQTIYLRQSRDHVRKYPDMPRDVNRTATEVKTLAFLDRVAPGSVPKVINFDETNNTLALSDIRGNSNLLADELATGRIHPEAGLEFGKIIGHIQATTLGQTLGDVLGSDVTPPKAATMAAYLGLRTSRARELAPELTDRILTESDKAPKAFILGDLASKNIFVDGEHVRFLDFERVFIGDLAYDPAYLFCHYLVEGENAPKEQVLEFIDNFMQTYLEAIGNKLSPQELMALQTRIAHHLGMSILHRTAGSHFVSYDGSNKDLWELRALKLMQAEDVTSVTDVIRAV